MCDLLVPIGTFYSCGLRSTSTVVESRFNFLIRVVCSLRDVGASEFRSRKKLLTKQEKEPTARFVRSESSRVVVSLD